MCVCVCVSLLQYELLSVLFEGQLALEHINLPANHKCAAGAMSNLRGQKWEIRECNAILHRRPCPAMLFWQCPGTLLGQHGALRGFLATNYPKQWARPGWLGVGEASKRMSQRYPNSTGEKPQKGIIHDTFHPLHSEGKLIFYLRCH